MSKFNKHLSKGQKRQIEINHKKRLNENLEETVEDSHFGAPKEGLIIARFGHLADTENEHGELFRCHIRRTLSAIVAGDRVIFREKNDELKTGIIDAICERKSVLMRPDVYDGLKLVAANLDQIVIVSAILPEFSTNILDRYLVVCEKLQIQPIIVLNKMDLLEKENEKNLYEIISIYQNLGYKFFLVSTKNSQGLNELKNELKGKSSIFVGQSGVGKSSLLNYFLFENKQQIDTKSVSENSGLGVHTTTVSRLYHLNKESFIIDSPGVRELGLWHLTEQDILENFIEFRPFLGRCQFRNCLHRKEDKNCAFWYALTENKISKMRFENYQKIVESTKKVANDPLRRAK